MMAQPRIKNLLLLQAGPNFQYTEVDEASNVFEAALVTSIFWLVRPYPLLVCSRTPPAALNAMCCISKFRPLVP